MQCRMQQAPKLVYKGPRAQAVQACKQAIKEVYTGKMLTQQDKLKAGAMTEYAGNALEQE